MTSSTFDKVALGGAVLLLLPALLTPAGWLFAAILALLWLITLYGGRYALEVEKERRKGERGRIRQIRDQSRGDRE